ncbi:MAG: hypothetical protein PHE12_00725 [Clostridia bacterium]|nr:hypothetical protein [Clostridia bacterium]
MKLIVPDIIVPSSKEKTLRQYRFAKVSAALSNMNCDLTLAVTNKRLIYHAETSSSKKSELIHNEIFIDNVGGFSLFRGKKKDSKGLMAKILVLFFIFGALGGAAFWQAKPIYDFAVTLIAGLKFDTMFKVIITAVPMLIFLIIALIINAKAHKYLINMIIYSKGLKVHNLFSDNENLIDTDNYIVIPYLKETQAMVAELASLILDVQQYGHEEVLKHIDIEES